MIVVKLGGSLYNTLELKSWLNTLAEQSKYQAIVIVPGGGPFADQVRQAQTVYNFSDSHAHHMALLAMTQFGLLLSDIAPKCQLLHIPNNNLDTALERLSVWLPDQKLLDIDILKHNWNITSDSLALWLANELQAEQLILIKKVDTLNNNSIAELCKLGIIDRGFPNLHCQIPVPTQIIDAKDYNQFSKQFSNDVEPRWLLA